MSEQATTVEEREALPVGSVLRIEFGEDADSIVLEREDGPWWIEAGVARPYSSDELPRGSSTTVLYRPDRPVRTTITRAHVEAASRTEELSMARIGVDEIYSVLSALGFQVADS